MAFVKKTWLQRIVDFPGRRKLSPTEIPNTYDVTRDEGNIIQAGDGLTAVNLNDLENRIEAAINERIEKIMIVQNAISTNPETVASGPALKAVNDKLTETNNNLGAIKQVNGIVPANGSLSIQHTPGSFVFLVTIQGRNSASYASYIFQGYGAGDTRDHYAKFMGGSSITESIVENALVINNSLSEPLEIYVTVLQGVLPTLSDS